MATTGTNTFTLDLAELIEEAYERAGGSARSGYDFATARRSLNLLLVEWGTRGVNLWTIDEFSIPLVAGTATYVLPDGTIDIIEHKLRTTVGGQQQDTPLNRISVSTYAALPNKLIAGRPIQIYVQRLAAPQVTFWPVPDAAQAYALRAWRLRAMYDAGDGANTADMPVRMLPALVAGLAYHLSLKTPDGLARRELLKTAYDEAWDTAAGEDRERASLRIVPSIGR